MRQRDETDKIVEMLREFFERYLLPNYEKKNRAYASTDVTPDAFSNFRTNAKRLGITEEQVFGIFFGKHVDAIFTWIRTGKAPDEVHRILNDIATYALMQIMKRVVDGDTTLNIMFNDTENETKEA